MFTVADIKGAILRADCIQRGSWSGMGGGPVLTAREACDVLVTERPNLTGLEGLLEVLIHGHCATEALEWAAHS